jgi:hypothetical protein
MRPQAPTPSPSAANCIPSRTHSTAVGEASGISDCPRAGRGEGKIDAPQRHRRSLPLSAARTPRLARFARGTPGRAGHGGRYNAAKPRSAARV